MNKPLSIDALIEKATRFRPTVDAGRLRRAFSFAQKAYEGHKRYSGDPYITHPLKVMDILLPLKPDDDTLVASLLHGLLGDTKLKAKDLHDEFGSSVSSMVEALETLKTLQPNLDTTSSENFRQMLMAMAKDMRVILIRLADRLHNMETLQFLPPERQKIIARETMQIYAPLASRLGIYSFKSRLEDLAFKYLNPVQYQNIEEQLSVFGREKGHFIDEIAHRLKSYLESESISCVVEGRVKSIYSIYRKLKRKSRTSIHDLFDVFAIRVLLNSSELSEKESNEQLYAVLGLIHSQWTPLTNRFKDYVAVPKPNGYKSLHTTVIGLAPKVLGQPVEIQIRTDRMHQEAEYGIASHWLYEDTKGASTQFLKDSFLKEIPRDQLAKSQVEWLSNLAKLQEDLKDDQNLYEELKVDLFSDRIFVLTPHGEIKDLPVGATPVDFAYNVHTNVGHCCAMAKVNGHVVPLDHHLKSGDVVEIILKPKPNPKPLWLSFVKTNAAKLKIKAWFRSQNRELSLREGKELLNRQLVRFNKAKLDEKYSILKGYSSKMLNLRERENLVESVGNGSTPANVVIRKIFSSEELLAPAEVVHRQKSVSDRPLEEKILLGGEAGLPLKLAQCCSPKEFQPIVGYITRGQRATIHGAHCKIVRRASSNRILQASWEGEAVPLRPKYHIHVAIEAVDRIGLIRDLTTVISDMGINILDFGYKEKKENAVTYLVVVEVEDFEQLNDLLNRLEQVQGVLRANREEKGESPKL